MMALWEVYSSKFTLNFFTLNSPELNLTTDKIRISRFSTFLREMKHKRKESSLEL